MTSSPIVAPHAITLFLGKHSTTVANTLFFFLINPCIEAENKPSQAKDCDDEIPVGIRRLLKVPQEMLILSYSIFQIK